MGRNSRHDTRLRRESSSTLPQRGNRTPAIGCELVTDGNRFKQVMERVSRERRIGFDLESNGFFRYPERICLIQLFASRRIYLIDPLAIDDMSPLGEVLADEHIETVLHSGDHDIRSLDRDWGFHVGKPVRHEHRRCVRGERASRPRFDSAGLLGRDHSEGEEHPAFGLVDSPS